MSPGDVQRGEIHGALFKPHTGCKGAWHGAVAADGKGHAIALATCHEVGQIKGINIVTFDDVRVTFPQQVHQLSQHDLFRTLASIEDVVPTTIIREGDENNPVLGTLRMRKGPGSIDFDIELQAMYLIKGHLFEERTSRLHQILLGWVGDEVQLLGRIILRTCRLRKMADSVPVRLPGCEHDEIAVRIAPTERFAAELVAWKAVQQADVSQKEERIEGDGLSVQPSACLMALIYAHQSVPGPLTRRKRLHSHQTRRQTMPKQGYIISRGSVGG